MPAEPAPISDRPVPTGTGIPRRVITAEVLIVLGLSLGQSGVYAIVRLLEKLSRGPLAGQTTTLNPVLDERPYFDLTYQLLGIVFALVPVALVLLLLSGQSTPAVRRLGLTLDRPVRTIAFGVGLAAIVGVGTLGVYAGAVPSASPRPSSRRPSTPTGGPSRSSSCPRSGTRCSRR